MDALQKYIYRLIYKVKNTCKTIFQMQELGRLCYISFKKTVMQNTRFQKHTT